MNQENKSDITKFNEASVEEASELLKSEGIVIDGDNIVAYVQHVPEIDEIPNQLIGGETEDSLVDMEQLYIDIVAVGQGVDENGPKAGEKFYMHDKLHMSALPFIAGGLKFILLPARLVTIRKKA